MTYAYRVSLGQPKPNFGFGFEHEHGKWEIYAVN